MPAIFIGLSASPNSSTPMVKVPTAPMPVPYRVGDADLQHLQRPPEQEHERGQQDQRDDAPAEARVAVGIFHRDRPADVEKAGGYKCYPSDLRRHGRAMRRASAYARHGAPGMHAAIADSRHQPP